MLETLISESKALERAIVGEELTFQDGIEIMEYDNIHLLGAVADLSRQKLVGEQVTFTSSSYLNYTNVCAASCQICAFYRKENDNDSYTLTPEQIEKRALAAKNMGATEVHIVGGFHPKLSLDYYESMMKIIKKNHPELKIKAFTAAEIFFFARLTKNSIKEILNIDIKQIPGSGAAGGLGAGLMAFLNADLLPGVDVVLETLRIESYLEEADLVITGEGQMDYQTVFNKAPIGIAKRAKKKNIPVIAIAGSLGKGYEQVFEHGIDGVTAAVLAPMPLTKATDEAKSLVALAAERAIRLIEVGRNFDQ